ncbi:hypothetical protein [Alkanindiges illinoisensis]|uniref:hypothetical protein n=1 Tax=Alkanindiges illinoisensis TaxID=197183 RepID=UPI00047AAFEC|nr:hypothetical protein [Alkanindiges illinoisensis]
MTNSNQTNSANKNQQAEHDAKQDILQDAKGQDSALTDIPPEFTVNNRDNSESNNADRGANSNAAPDSTDAGYDETVANDPVGGLEEMDIDDLIDTNEEELEEITGLATSTPSPTAREDEDRSALPEANVAGEVPAQDM